MNFDGNLSRKQTSKKRNQILFFPRLHAKYLSLMMMTLTLKLILLNCCIRTLNDLKLLEFKTRLLKLMNLPDDWYRIQQFEVKLPMRGEVGGVVVPARRVTITQEGVTYSFS